MIQYIFRVLYCFYSLDRLNLEFKNFLEKTRDEDLNSQILSAYNKLEELKELREKTLKKLGHLKKLEMEGWRYD